VDAPAAWTWFVLLAVTLVAAGVVIWWIKKRR
jgi:LPXTG-motif cell wall-anchored protein